MKMGDKVIVYGYIDGYSYETTGQTNYIIALETGERVEIPLGGAINVDEIVFKDNIKLKDVIKRIKGFDDGTKFKWMYDILQELGSDFYSKTFHEAYQQGKLEGAWVGNQLKDADKIRRELNKPVVPQVVIDYYEFYKGKLVSFEEWFAKFEVESDEDFQRMDEVGKWLYDVGDFKTQTQRELALAMLIVNGLDAVEIEKEKRYTVTVKGDIKEKLFVYGKTVKRYFFTKDYDLYNVIYSHTRKQLEEAGFGWVFDCEGIEIKEVKG